MLLVATQKALSMSLLPSGQALFDDADSAIGGRQSSVCKHCSHLSTLMFLTGRRLGVAPLLEELQSGSHSCSGLTLASAQCLCSSYTARSFYMLVSGTRACIYF